MKHKQILQVGIYILDTLLATSSGKDSFQIFYLFYLPRLSLLDPVNKLFARMKVCFCWLHELTSSIFDDRLLDTFYDYFFCILLK